MSCPFTGPKMFCAGPNFSSQPKNLTAFRAPSKTFVLAQKPVLLMPCLFMPCPFTGLKMFCVSPNFLSQPKNLTAFSASSKTFVLAILLNANHLYVWHKMFVTATICEYIFGLAQKSWTSTKHFGTFKRTRQKIYLYHRNWTWYELSYIVRNNNAKIFEWTTKDWIVEKQVVQVSAQKAKIC